MSSDFDSTSVPLVRTGEACCVQPGAERLRAFALGRLDESELIEVSEHLEVCERCRSFAELIPADWLVTLVRSVKQPPERLGDTRGPLRLHRGFELLDEIGRGGMSVVYRARQPGLSRIVAFKQLRQDLLDADGLKRFQTEAGVMARVQHPHIVQVHDVGEQDGVPYLTMEFVAGGGLDRQLHGHPLPVRAACRLLATVARALQVAHDHQIIHRDLKPSNILLSWPVGQSADPLNEAFWNDVVPRIGDFGLAKDGSHLERQTQTGEILGTPGYISPEQARGVTQEITPATDIFSLGVVLYELLTGRRPFQGATPLQTLELIGCAEPVPPAYVQPQLPSDLNVICLKCLEKDPSRRYHSATALADDLQAWLENRPIQARPAGPGIRLWKWIRRNRIKTTMITGAVIVFVALLIGVILHNWRLQAEVVRANRNQSIAIANFRRGHDVVQRMIDDVAGIAVNTREWRQLRDRLYQHARDYHDNALEGADEASGEVRLARAMAQVYRGSMLVVSNIPTSRDQARAHLEPARQNLEQLLAEFPDQSDVRSSLASCYRNLGWMHFAADDAVSAEQNYLKSIEHVSWLTSHAPQDLAFRRRLAGLYGDLGAARMVMQDYEPCRVAYAQAVEIWETLVLDSSFSDVDRARFAQICLNGALISQLTERLDEAQSQLQRNEVLLAPCDGPGFSISCRKILAETHWRLHQLAEIRHQFPDSLQRVDRAIAVVEGILAEEPQEEDAREALSRYLQGRSLLRGSAAASSEQEAIESHSAELSTVELQAAAELSRIEKELMGTAGQWNTAVADLQQLEQRLIALTQGSGAPETQRILADVYFAWGEAEISRDQLDQALIRYDQSLSILDQTTAQHPEDAEVRAVLAARYRLKAWHLSRAGQNDAALQAWDRAVEFAADDFRTYTRIERALEMALLGNHAAAMAEANAIVVLDANDPGAVVHLARVYSACIAALGTDGSLSPHERGQLTDLCASAAVGCLQRLPGEFLQQLGGAAALTADPQLKSLAASAQFRHWVTAGDLRPSSAE